jgi:hypothetical protein
MLLITSECLSWLSQGSIYAKVTLFLRISSGSMGDITFLPTPARNNAQYAATEVAHRIASLLLRPCRQGLNSTAFQMFLILHAFESGMHN